MSDYPRTRNGWVDSGEPLSSNKGKTLRCPNCNSTEYSETLSLEHCRKCNYRVDYWGGGSNEVAESYFSRQAAAERQREWEREQELQREHERQFYHWDEE